MTNNTEQELRQKLIDIVFSASGGISDMAQDEVDQIMQLFSTHLNATLTKMEAEVLELAENVNNGELDSAHREFKAVPLKALKTLLTKYRGKS